MDLLVQVLQQDIKHLQILRCPPLKVGTALLSLVFLFHLVFLILKAPVTRGSRDLGMPLLSVCTFSYLYLLIPKKSLQQSGVD
jgi:hypothetical protein